MASIVMNMSYYIYFRDPTEYDAAIAIYGTGFTGQISPVDVLTSLGISPTFPATVGGDKGVTFIHPFTPGAEIGFPNPSGVLCDINQISVTVPGQFGGPDGIFVWSFTIVRIGNETGANPSPEVAIPQRRFGGGFELAMTGEGGSGLNAARAGCRDSSRTVEGLGWGFRNETGQTLTRTLNEYDSGLAPASSWERIYIRVRRAPTSNTVLWRTAGSLSGLAGGRLQVNTGLTLTITNNNGAGAVTRTANGATVLVIDEWYKIDIIAEYAANTGRIRLYIGGILEASISNITTGEGGLGQAGGQTHAQSILGDISGGGTNGIEIDFDDWENAAIPQVMGVEQLESLDWLTGTHYRRVNAVTAAADNSGWTPTQVESFNQMISPLGSSATSRYASSTALARLHGITNATDEVEDVTGFNFGAIAAVIGLYSSRNGTADGQLGFSIALAVTIATIVQSTATIFNSRIYRPSGMITPDPILPFGVVHDKGNSTDSSLVLGLQAAIGYIGTWGLEDDPEFLTFVRTPIIHNAPYFNTIWANSGPIVDAPCGAFGGTYVGNGTFQEIELLAPAHFIWIRPLTGGVGGVKWHAAGLGGHLGGTDRVVPDFVVRSIFDPTDGIPKFIVTGNDPQVNELGETYQYIAFSDPGMRYNICSAFRHSSALATAVNTLFDSTFTPEFMWTQSDNLNTAGSTVVSACKGPGDGANAGTELDGSALANYATFAAGAITSRANLHLATSQVNFSAWRTDDGSGYVAVQILTYTGNGVSPRVIPLTPVSGRFPLFAYVQPANAQGFFRDPSHTGANSSSFDLGTNSTTAITAGGVDSITVGATLNSNGVVYNVFVLPGDEAGWDNGDFPAPSGAAPGDAWDEEVHDAPIGLIIVPEGGLVMNGQPALLMLQDVSGIYTLVPDKTNDTLIDRQTGQTEINVKIPNPDWKTGYVGG